MSHRHRPTVLAQERALDLKALRCNNKAGRGERHCTRANYHFARTFAVWPSRMRALRRIAASLGV